MTERYQPKRKPLFERDPDVRVTMWPRRAQEWTVNLDVADEVMPQLAEEVVRQAARVATERLYYELGPQIHRLAEKLLLDPEWAKPIIEAELRRAAREMVLSLWNDDEKQNLRDWFDLFTAKVRGADQT